MALLPLEEGAGEEEGEGAESPSAEDKADASAGEVSEREAAADDGE